MAKAWDKAAYFDCLLYWKTKSLSRRFGKYKHGYTVVPVSLCSSYGGEWARGKLFLKEIGARIKRGSDCDLDLICLFYYTERR